MTRVIQDNLKKPLANELLFGQLSHGGAVKIDLNKQTQKLTYYFEGMHKTKPENVII